MNFTRWYIPVFYDIYLKIVYCVTVVIFKIVLDRTVGISRV
jgi:hypothetical protein